MEEASTRSCTSELVGSLLGPARQLQGLAFGVGIPVAASQHPQQPPQSARHSFDWRSSSHHQLGRARPQSPLADHQPPRRDDHGIAGVHAMDDHAGDLARDLPETALHVALRCLTSQPSTRPPSCANVRARGVLLGVVNQRRIDGKDGVAGSIPAGGSTPTPQVTPVQHPACRRATRLRPPRAREFASSI